MRKPGVVMRAKYVATQMYAGNSMDINLEASNLGISHSEMTQVVKEMREALEAKIQATDILTMAGNVFQTKFMVDTCPIVDDAFIAAREKLYLLAENAHLRTAALSK